MKKISYTAVLLFLMSTPAWAHQGHGAVTHPVHVSWGLQGASEIQNIHPLFVHFPVALLLAAVAFFLAGLVSRKEDLALAGRWALYAGAASTIPAVWTGLRAAETVAHDEEVHQIMMRHEYLGITLLILGIVWSLWLAVSRSNLPRRGRPLFIAGLLVMGAVVLQQADFGGRMVFLKGTGVGPAKHAVRAVPSDTVREKWQAIDSHMNHLKTLIEADDLGRVHEAAFAVRDLAKALPQGDLTADQKTVFQSLLEEVEKEANLLDEYGDSGNLAEARRELNDFDRSLFSIKRLYERDGL